MNKILISARKVKQQLISYRQGDYPNIALIAAIRGGSTLVADMLAAQKGMWFMNEPFALRNSHKLDENLQKLVQTQPNQDCRFFHLHDSEKREFHGYIQKLNRNEIRIGTTRHTQFPLRTNRACVKILRASWLTDHFSDQGMQTLFVIRHPAAQAISVIRLGWLQSAEIYFEQPDFLRHYFSSKQVEYGLKILAEGSQLQKAILSWVCDVIYPLKYSQKVTYRLFYEQLITDSETCIQNLCHVLNLSNSKVMAQVLSQPSGSSRLSNSDINKAIIAGDSQLLLNKWRNQLNDTERKSAQEVLDHFEISCYNMYEIMPTVPLCH